MYRHSSDEVTKSDLARELGITPARVSQYLARGLPKLPDGRLSRAAALEWLGQNIDRGRCGSAMLRAIDRAERRAAEAYNVARAARRGASNGAAPAEPPARRPDPGAAARWMAAVAIGEVEAAAAALLVRADTDLATAYAISSALVIGTWEALEERLREAGHLGDSEELLLDEAALTRADWPRLAEAAGGAVDADAWQKRLLELFGGDHG